jgi:hypothetical protein
MALMPLYCNIACEFVYGVIYPPGIPLWPYYMVITDDSLHMHAGMQYVIRKAQFVARLGD